MKKDSIQTRKRKPKGQGKGKNLKNRSIKTTEKEQTKSKIMDPSLSSAALFPSCPGSIPDHSIGSMVAASNLSVPFAKQAEVSENARSDPAKISASPVNHSDPALYVGSSPDSATGNHQMRKSDESQMNEVQSPSKSEHYSPLSECVPDGNSQNLVNTKQTMLNEGLDRIATAYYDYTNQSERKDLPLIDTSAKTNYATEQQAYANRLTGDIDSSAEAFPCTGLASIYAGNSAAPGPVRDGQHRRHFSLYHPYSYYEDYRSSFIKSEPAVN